MNREQFKCGHPRTIRNTQEVSNKYPMGRCRRCRITARREVRGVTNPRFALPPLSDLSQSIEIESKRVRSDVGTIRAGTATHFSCGHERSAENVRKNGTPNGCCRTCNNATAQRLRDDAKADRATAHRDDFVPAIALYRTEKAKADERRQRAVLAEAKREYDAMLRREAEGRKGGRPRTFGRPQINATKCDPADALLVALGHFGGAA